MLSSCFLIGWRIIKEPMVVQERSGAGAAAGAAGWPLLPLQRVPSLYSVLLLPPLR
jgi:hypothetical protein